MKWIPRTLLVLLLAATGAPAEEMIVCTAHQGFLSRIYLLHMDGTVEAYHEYDFYYFADVEVVNNEVYVAEAFAPRVYKVDPQTGDLDLLIDDWSLFVFYDVAFDGTYFYVDEWSLNRYNTSGQWQGSASFDEYVMGGTWDGNNYWTLNDLNQMRCWDLSQWPTVTELPENSFAPPTPECRGLWHDGEFFWSSESLDGIGKIYRFDRTGSVVQEWFQPAFQGWAACVISIDATGVPDEASHIPLDVNLRPNTPNPFRHATTFHFSLPQETQTSLRIFDPAGRLVRTLVSGKLAPGDHRVQWDATGLESGVYFSRLEAAGSSETRRVLLIR
jgi:hypothetical protein